MQAPLVVIHVINQIPDIILDLLDHPHINLTLWTIIDHNLSDSYHTPQHFTRVNVQALNFIDYYLIVMQLFK